MDDLRKDSAACPPLGMRILLSTSVLCNFFITKVDIKSAFLQSGEAQRDVYVVPPRESAKKYFYWLLKVASYGLVNANAKWKSHSNNTLFCMGLEVVAYVTQLFFRKENGILKLIVTKVVDEANRSQSCG